MRQCAESSFREWGPDAIFKHESRKCRNAVDFFQDKITRNGSQCKCLNPLDGNFCNTCGFNLHSPSAANTSGLSANDQLDILQRYLPRGATKRILKHRNKLEGERRQATVMFCDMDGFTQLAADLESEVIYRMMDRVYEFRGSCDRNRSPKTSTMSIRGCHCCETCNSSLRPARVRVRLNTVSNMALHKKPSIFQCFPKSDDGCILRLPA